MWISTLKKKIHESNTDWFLDLSGSVRVFIEYKQYHLFEFTTTSRLLSRTTFLNHAALQKLYTRQK